MNTSVARAVLALLALTAWAQVGLAQSDSYRLELILDEEAHELYGLVHVTYWNDSSAPLEELRFRLDLEQVGSRPWVATTANTFVSSQAEDRGACHKAERVLAHRCKRHPVDHWREGLSPCRNRQLLTSHTRLEGVRDV